MMTFDIAVIGLGMIGAAALRALSEGGAAVVGIGPGEPSDWSRSVGPFASHYDHARITRVTDPDRIWATLARRSIDAYPTIAAQGNHAFHHTMKPCWSRSGVIAPSRPRAATPSTTPADTSGSATAPTTLNWRRLSASARSSAPPSRASTPPRCASAFPPSASPLELPACTRAAALAGSTRGRWSRPSLRPPKPRARPFGVMW